jgi:hypothetical protein
MAEVAVAFPLDEATAQLIVSRLGVDGIKARVDRGLSGAYLTNTANQLTVLVDEKDAKKARAIVDAASPKRRR